MHGASTDLLNQLSVPLVDMDICQMIYKSGLEVNEENHICAGGERGLIVSYFILINHTEYFPSNSNHVTQDSLNVETHQQPSQVD